MFEKKEIDHAVFPEQYSDFIMLRGHRMYSLCPHHLLPVEFDVTVAYVPDGDVLGLSKLARILDEANDRPLLQERFTHRVTGTIQGLVTNSQGAACLIRGTHGCTKIRGIRSAAEFLTYSLVGCFKSDPILESRFFDLARGGPR